MPYHVFLLVLSLLTGEPHTLMSKAEFKTKAECQKQITPLYDKAQKFFLDKDYLVVGGICATINEMLPKPEERKAGEERVD